MSGSRPYQPAIRPTYESLSAIVSSPIGIGYPSELKPGLGSVAGGSAGVVDLSSLGYGSAGVFDSSSFGYGSTGGVVGAS